MKEVMNMSDDLRIVWNPATISLKQSFAQSPDLDPEQVVILAEEVEIGNVLHLRADLERWSDETCDWDVVASFPSVCTLAEDDVSGFEQELMDTYLGTV